MTTQRKSASKLQLRRSISEQLRESTSKAWDLLWRNVRERRLAGQRTKKGSGAQMRNAADHRRLPLQITAAAEDIC
ncbi:hypothetical protein OJAV_G00141490 [Oryzias javanicus]|uniref:Uncharacterized protein n=1 Tax=Oryzias javanicus TaxID=123683 RepID=A0A3S2PLD1_ORYJA|nr:hypothetical protein OJAV_G00141490 [Oryzias javanicus]